MAEPMLETTKVRIGTAIASLVAVLSALGVAMTWADAQHTNMQTAEKEQHAEIKAKQSSLEQIQRNQAAIITDLGTAIQLLQKGQGDNQALIREAASAAKANREVLIRIETKLESEGR